MPPVRVQDMLSPTARAAAVHSAAAGASGHGGGLTSTQSLPPMQRGDQVWRRVPERWSKSCTSRALPADCSSETAVVKANVLAVLPSGDGAEAASASKAPRALLRLRPPPLTCHAGRHPRLQAAQPAQPTAAAVGALRVSHAGHIPAAGGCAPSLRRARCRLRTWPGRRRGHPGLH